MSLISGEKCLGSQRLVSLKDVPTSYVSTTGDYPLILVIYFL